MPNPILEQIRAQSGNPLQTPQQQPFQNNQSFASIKNLYKMLRNSRDSSAMLQTILSQYPQAQQVVNLAQNKNLSYQQIFLELAKQKGVDPNKFIQELQS